MKANETRKGEANYHAKGEANYHAKFTLFSTEIGTPEWVMPPIDRVLGSGCFQIPAVLETDENLMKG